MKQLTIKGITFYYKAFTYWHTYLHLDPEWRGLTYFYDKPTMMKKKHWWSKQLIEVENTDSLFSLPYNIDTETSLTKEKLTEFLEKKADAIILKQQRKNELENGIII